MKVLFVLALALAQGFALSNDQIQISNMPSQIQISNLPAEIGVGTLPGQIDISNLPSEIGAQEEIGISHLPADLPSAPVESTPACVTYVRTLLKEILASLPGRIEEESSAPQRPYVPGVPMPEAVEPVVEGSACTRCFQKLQLLIEKANSRNSAALTF